ARPLQSREDPGRGRRAQELSSNLHRQLRDSSILPSGSNERSSGRPGYPSFSSASGHSAFREAGRLPDEERAESGSAWFLAFVRSEPRSPPSAGARLSA